MPVRPRSGAGLGFAVLAAATLVLIDASLSVAAAHGVADRDAAYLESVAGFAFWPYLYLGAKHMVTGYDHVLFLVGVVFFLYRFRDVALYVSMFSIGHSITLLTGVLGHIAVNPFAVDAVIGLSVTYKALDNLGAFRTLFGVEPNPKAAVLLFGLVHGFGLATKLQGLQLSAEGLVPNMLAFNIGVELGQILVLVLVLSLMSAWRATPSFRRMAVATNVVLLAAGVLLFEVQLAGLLSGAAA
ncbi:MAG: HupE/UreJ family protein [Bauldia sp.]